MWADHLCVCVCVCALMWHLCAHNEHSSAALDYELMYLLYMCTVNVYSIVRKHMCAWVMRRQLFYQSGQKY